MSENYNIDSAKNDIQNLQDQNSYDFQEIKRLDRLIKDYDKRILQAINFNNLINEKIQSQLSLLLDRIKYIEDNTPASSGSGLTITQSNQLNEAYKHSQSYHVSKQEIQLLNSNVNSINNKLNNHINSQHLSQTYVESIVNQLNGEIQTQISLILDRIKRLEDNSSSTPDVPDTPVTPPDEPDEPDTPVTPPDEPDEPDTPVTPPDEPDTSGSYVTDENGNRLMAEDGSYLITD